MTDFEMDLLVSRLDQEIKRNKAKARHDMHVKRTCKQQQALLGMVIIILSVVGLWHLTKFYGQWEYVIFTVIFVITGLRFIFTKENFFYSIWREDHR